MKENLPGHPDDGKWNHPAGWIDLGESPFDAVIREVREETGYEFTPTDLLGVYSIVRSDLKLSPRGQTPHALKFIFMGRVPASPTHELTHEISETRWFSADKIQEMGKGELRDEDVKQALLDYQSGQRYPLALFHHHNQTN